MQVITYLRGPLRLSLLLGRTDEKMTANPHIDCAVSQAAQVLVEEKVAKQSEANMLHWTYLPTYLGG